MVLKSFDAASTAMAVFIFATLAVYNGGGGYGDTGWVQGASLLVHVPFTLFIMLATVGIPLIGLAALLLFIAYLGGIRAWLGEGMLAIGIFASLALTLGA